MGGEWTVGVERLYRQDNIYYDQQQDNILYYESTEPGIHVDKKKK